MNDTLEIQPRQVKRYGWKPSLPDQRDVFADPSGIPVLEEVDPRHEMTPIYDQDQLGSCTANAVAAAIDYWFIVNGEEPFYPSRLALYYLERLVGGLPVSEDTGAYGRDGFKVARKYGLIEESEYPYDISKFADDPTDKIKAQAKLVKLGNPYKRVRRTIADWKSVLSNKQTIAFGFSVYESFESQTVSITGIVPHPQPTETLLGGHEVLAVGYLADYPEYALCRNSWSEKWGLAGYFLMPWTMILDPNISDDFRTIYRPLAQS